MIARRVVRPIGVLALTTGLALSALPTLAQEERTVGAQLDLAGAPVDLHEGTCAAPTADPWASIGRLDRQDYGEIDDAAMDAESIEEGGEDDPLTDDEEDEGLAIEDEDEIGVLEGGEITETGREGDPVEESAEAAAALGEEISDELAEDYGDQERSAEGSVAGTEEDELVDESAAAMIVDDVPAEDVDEVLGEEDTAEADPEARPLTPTFYVAEGGVDADYEALFNQPNVIAVHQSPDQYDTILACGSLGAVELDDQLETENDSEVVVGMAPIEGSGVRGYAVFEYDAAIFGNDVIAVTVHIFERLPTQRDRAMADEVETVPDS